MTAATSTARPRVAKRRGGAGAVALLVLVALGGGVGADALAATKASFDWRMPARTGLDRNQDGVVDALDTPSEIDPEDWTVYFDACASGTTDGATIVSYAWYIEGQWVRSTRSCEGFSHKFPEEGTYQVVLIVTDSRGTQAYSVKDVPVQDWLIVALGDSFGSGQGNPDIPIPGPDIDAAEQALRTYNERLGDLRDLEGAYDDTDRLVGVVRVRLADLQRALLGQIEVCDLLSGNYDFGACAQETVERTAALLAALRDLGLETLIDTLHLIEDSLQDALEVAQAAVDAARTLAANALDVLDNARASLSPTWQNRRCNRSAIAGQAQAAIALEEADPRTSVTLVHLACSGAEVVSGLIGPYAGVEVPAGAPDLPPQVDKAAALVGDREVDAVLLSIGGNDSGFGPVIEACMKQEPCYQTPTSLEAAVDQPIAVLCAVQDLFGDGCQQWWEGITDDLSAEELFDNGSSGLRGRYTRLADRLDEVFPAVLAEPGRVYITEYPDALEHESGRLCNSTEDADPFVMLPGISVAEADWLRNTMTVGINDIVQAAATDHGWTYVGGIFDRFNGRGYCSQLGLFRRFQDSLVMQATKEGTAHPTAYGQTIYGQQILAQLMTGLYVGGGDPAVNPPRPPRPIHGAGDDVLPPVVTGIASRPPDSAGWYAAEVTIDWQATDPAPSSGTPTDPPDTIASTEGSGITYTSEPSCDPIGHCAGGSIALSIDTTPPAVACQAPAPAFTLGEAGATVSATVTDALSGPVAATVTADADTGTAGAKTVSLTGADAAGNTRTVTCDYGVAYVFGGFQQPVDEGGILNVVKAGRAVPLKWRLTDAAGAPVTSLATATVTVQGLDCAAGTSADLVEETVAGGSGLQNLGDGYYQLNWKSPSSYANSCKTLRLDLGEGLSHTAIFKFQ